jgi:cytoskeletal protein CcmA (bactofilin family)
MRTLVADERYDTSDDTVRLPSLPDSFIPESAVREVAAALDNSTPRAADSRIAVLGPTLRFKGDISAEEDFILLGRVEGSIHQAQRIVIAGGGAVVGTVHARVIVVNGTVQGDLYGVESVTVQKTGRVVGNIFAPRVVLIDGAVFNGRIDMSGDAVVDRDVEPADKVAAQKVVLVPPPRVGRTAVG